MRYLTILHHTRARCHTYNRAYAIKEVYEEESEDNYKHITREDMLPFELHKNGIYRWWDKQSKGKAAR